MLKLHKKSTIEQASWFIISDAIGLVAFGLTGAVVGIEEGLSIFGIMVLAFLTASGGGVIRDLMVNQVPAILNSDFYGSVAILIAISLYILEIFGMRNDATMGVVLVIALILRIVAWQQKWHLPRIKTDKTK